MQREKEEDRERELRERESRRESMTVYIPVLQSSSATV